MARVIRGPHAKRNHPIPKPRMQIKRYPNEVKAISAAIKVEKRLKIPDSMTSVHQPHFKNGNRVGLTVLTGVERPAVIMVTKPKEKKRKK
jgi:hypothetical protein